MEVPLNGSQRGRASPDSSLTRHTCIAFLDGLTIACPDGTYYIVPEADNEKYPLNKCLSNPQ